MMSEDLSSNEYKTHWIFSTGVNSQSRFVAVVVHGLNLKPQKMCAISQALSAAGGDVLQVGLPGHRSMNHKEEYDLLSSWSEHLQDCLIMAQNRAKSLGEAPVFFVGFSLGGVLYEALVAMRINELFQVKSVVLFAPALSLRFYAYFVKALFFLGDEFSLSSWTPTEYRVSSGLKLKYYRCLFQLIEQLQTLAPHAHDELNTPTIVFIDSFDFMVSPIGIKKFIEKNHLNHWHWEEIKAPLFPIGNGFHHLIIDPHSLGEIQWSLIKKKMLNHLFLSVGWPLLEQ